jgi:hypothetical protein
MERTIMRDKILMVHFRRIRFHVLYQFLLINKKSIRGTNRVGYSETHFTKVSKQTSVAFPVKHGFGVTLMKFQVDQ